MNFTKISNYLYYLLVDGISKLGPFIVVLFLGKKTSSEELLLLENYIIFSNLFVNVFIVSQNSTFISNLYDSNREKYNLKAVLILHSIPIILSFLLSLPYLFYAALFSLFFFVFNMTQSYENIKGSPAIQRKRDLFYALIFIIITISVSTIMVNSYLLRVIPVLLSLLILIVFTTTRNAALSIMNYTHKYFSFSSEVTLLSTISFIQWFVIYADKLIFRIWNIEMIASDYFLLTSIMTVQLLICLSILKVVRRDLLDNTGSSILKTFIWYSVISLLSGISCFLFASIYFSDTSIIKANWGLVPLYFSISLFYFVHTLFLKANKKQKYIKVAMFLILFFSVIGFLIFYSGSTIVFHLGNTLLYLVLSAVLFLNSDYYDSISIKRA